MQAMLMRKGMQFLIKPVILAARQTFEGHNFTQTRTFIIAGHRQTRGGCILLYENIWLYKDFSPPSHSDSNIFANLLDGPLGQSEADL